MKKVFFVSSVFLAQILFAKDLVHQIKQENKPPYVNDKKLIIGTYPGSKVTITLNAIDPEGKGVYAHLRTPNPGDGISCEVKNAIQIYCNVPNIPLNKPDNCYITTVKGKTPVNYCKQYTIKYYLTDDGFNDLTPATSEDYTIILRVAKNVDKNLTREALDFRGYGSALRSSFRGVAAYNQNSVANLLTTSLQEQYNAALGMNDKSELFNNKIVNNSRATTALKNSISGTNTDYLLSKADTITAGTAASDVPIFCTIKRTGFFTSPAYVCTLDPMLSVSSDLATRYEYIEGDMNSQNYALSKCQSQCRQDIQCNDISGNVYYTLIENKNYITSDLANQNYLNKDYKVIKFIIEEKDTSGNVLSTHTITILGDKPASDFKWITDNDVMNTTNEIQSNLKLKCALRDNTDIKTKIIGDSFYVEPVQTCYVEADGIEYPRVNDTTRLYSFKLFHWKPQYVCPLDEAAGMIYEDESQCNNSCFYQGDCITVTAPLAVPNERLVNNCKDVILTNGERLQDAVEAKQCKLIDEVSLDENGNVKKVFMKNGVIKNPLREDIGFEESLDALKIENAIEMFGSFTDMIYKGKSEDRVADVNLSNQLVGFDGEVKNRNFDFLPLLYLRNSSKVSTSIAIKISPSLYQSIKNRSYNDINYSILPIALIVNKASYAEKDRFTKTYYLINLNSSPSKRYINQNIYLKRVAEVSSNTPFNPNKVVFKLSDGTWGMTKDAYDDNKPFIDASELNYSIIIPDDFLNKNREKESGESETEVKKFYFSLPENKTIVGVTNFDLLRESYNNYTRDKDNYYEKDRSFNKYSIEMDTSKEYHTIYLSSLTSRPDSVLYKGYPLIRIDDKYYLDKDNNGVINEKDRYPIRVDGWYFNLASKVSESPQWSSDYNPIIGKEITESDIIGTNWALSGNKDFGGGVEVRLDYPVKMSFSWGGDDYHIGIAVFNGGSAVGCYKTSNTSHFDCNNPPRTLPDYSYYTSKTDYKSESNLVNKTGNYFVMFNRDGKNHVDKRDFIRVDFLTTNTTPPFRYAIPKNPTFCPKGFTEDNGYCYRKNVMDLSDGLGIVPIEEEAGLNGYDPNTLQLDDKVDEWKIKKDFNFSKMVKNINLWDSLREGDVLVPQWLANINFNSFQDGKLFMIIDTKENIKNILDNIKTNGIDGLISLLERDFTGDKKYFAWDMTERYRNSSIFSGENNYKGLESIGVNKFIRFFGIYSPICPEGFYFDSGTQVCRSLSSSTMATPLIKYFTNEASTKAGPIYASFDKETLFIRAVPEVGMQVENTELICPRGYHYSSLFKLCIKSGPITECDAPNGGFIFPRDSGDVNGVCTASPSCSNGGFFDPSRDGCFKLTPTDYTGKNGYYFMFKKQGDGFDIYTPLSSPKKLKCILDKYKCPITNQIYNSKDICNTLCGGSCVFIAKEERDEYDDQSSCKANCGTHDDHYNGPGNLIIKNFAGFNKYSNINIYKNGRRISDAVKIIGGRLFFGNGTGLKISNVKPGDVITIRITSKSDPTTTQYLTGIGYWDDSLGNRVWDTASGQCLKLSKYFPYRNQIEVDYDVDNKNIPEAKAIISDFYCMSNTRLVKDIKIEVLGNKLNVNYFDNKLEPQNKIAEIDYFNGGECKAVDEKDGSIEPYFKRFLNSDFLARINVSSINNTYPSNSQKGIKDDNIDNLLINSFENMFCYYPYQKQYVKMKSSSSLIRRILRNRTINVSEMISLFNYNKVFEDGCPAYFNNDKVKLAKISNYELSSKKELYELGIQPFRENINSHEYDPIKIYNILNKEKLTTLPLGRGVYVNDNFTYVIPHFGRQSISLGYGYSPFDDCREVSGTAITTQTISAVKNSCNIPHVRGEWTYDNSIKKCVSPTIDGSCIYGTLQDGRCVLDPVCPSGYIEAEDGSCKKIVVHSYKTSNKICKPWWLLKRKYMCDGLESIFNNYLFGLPRWLTIKKVPVYRYMNYNFNNE